MSWLAELNAKTSSRRKKLEENSSCFFSEKQKDQRCDRRLAKNKKETKETKLSSITLFSNGKAFDLKILHTKNPTHIWEQVWTAGILTSELLISTGLKVSSMLH